MWLPNDIIAAVDRVARVTYVGAADTRAWNERRTAGELRLLSGWAWTARSGGAHRQGFKSMTVAYRDAWYELIRHETAPTITPWRRVRVVA